MSRSASHRLALGALALLLAAGSRPLIAQESRLEALTNQRLTDTMPTLPALWAERTAQFEREPVTTGGIVFLGNSITQGGDWVALTGNPAAINRGIGGDVTFGILHRLDEVIARKPAKLFLLIGINDISRDVPLSVIAANVREIIHRVRDGSPETTIYLQSVLPVNAEVPGFPQHYDKGDQVRRLNRLLRLIASSSHVRWVNLYPLFTDDRGHLATKYTRDGLHLNDAGYARWVAHLRRIGAL